MTKAEKILALSPVAEIEISLSEFNFALVMLLDFDVIEYVTVSTGQVLQPIVSIFNQCPTDITIRVREHIYRRDRQPFQKICVRQHLKTKDRQCFLR